MHMQRNIEERSCNHCCSGKAMDITQSLCAFVALGTKHAMRMRHIILSSVVCPTLQYFPTLSHKRHDFRKKKLLNQNVCFDFLYDFYLKYFSF